MCPLWRGPGQDRYPWQVMDCPSVQFRVETGYYVADVWRKNGIAAAGGFDCFFSLESEDEHRAIVDDSLSCVVHLIAESG